MSENRKIATLLIVTLFLGVAALGLSAAMPFLTEGDLVVDDYQAALYENGTFVERYTYDVALSNEYRMLFRFFDDRLTFVDASSPHVKFEEMKVPEGVIGYVKDASGEVRTYPAATEAETEFIRSMAYPNEVGLYNPGYFDAGTYVVEYRSVMRPPVEYDDEVAHVNLKLVREHIPYRHLTLTLPDWEGIETIYAYPPGLSVDRQDGTVTVTGRAAANDPVAVELLMPLSYLDQTSGFPHQVDNLRQKTEEGAFWYNLPYHAASV
ncbi:MAG: DUF2207 domain-containing protein, partial [Methanofollis sp.]|nr:DUF2207 domain-containing protein [Methanofollis sp.]